MIVWSLVQHQDVIGFIRDDAYVYPTDFSSDVLYVVYVRLSSRVHHLRAHASVSVCVCVSNVRRNFY